DDWTAQYVGTGKEVPQKDNFKTLSSKYATEFTYMAKAPVNDIQGPKVEKLSDTLVNDERMVEIMITPRRAVNRLDVFINDIAIKSASVNGISLPVPYLKNRKGDRFVTHYISDNEATTLHLVVPKDSPLQLVLYEASNDLLKNR